MPFTFAHPAAVLPLRWFRTVPTVFPALVIGSMTPDIVYFVPLHLDGEFSHSLAGLFLFCLPTGLLLYLLIRHLLRQPLIALLPGLLACRLPDRPMPRQTTAARHGLWVMLSLLIGAVTHLLWDDLTHHDTVVTLHGALLGELTGQHNIRIGIYPLAQHFSSIAGIMLLFSALRQWIGRTAPLTSYVERLGSSWRWLIWAGMVAVATAAMVLAWRHSAAEPLSLRGFHTVVAAIRWVAVALLGWCAAWYLQALCLAHTNAETRP
jgi:hypothetical protein